MHTKWQALKLYMRAHAQPLAVVIVVAVVGSGLLGLSRAGTNSSATEGETGQQQGGVSTVIDGSASNGHAIIFGTENPTRGAINVLDSKYGITNNANQTPDSTNAFLAAMSDALSSNVRYANGPSGAQAVVYVPPGSYRLFNLIFPSNIRLEVDAAAVLEPVQESGPHGNSDPNFMINMGSNDHTNQTVNASIVGVGVQTTTNAYKQRAMPTYNNWDLSHNFTINLDAADSGGWSDVSFVTMINLKGFLLKNMYFVQNGSIPCTVNGTTCINDTTGPYPRPTSGRAAIIFRPSNEDGPPLAGPFYDPTNGSVLNLYAIGGPYGFGPTQITAGHNLVFNNLYGKGGTTLRLETDASLNKGQAATADHAASGWGGELKGVTADNIIGENCNRAVSMTSHRQINSDVHLTNVKSISCNNALVQESENPAQYPVSGNDNGGFLNSTISGLTVIGGTTAQLPAKSEGGWSIGQSDRPVNTHPLPLWWSANITNFSCNGSFQTPTDPFTYNGVTKSTPACN